MSNLLTKMSKGKRGWNSNFHGGLGKRRWNSNFSGGLGKRAWNSNFSGGLGKRAWNKNFSGIICNSMCHPFHCIFFHRRIWKTSMEQ